ncbi:MAG: HDOD domain-containing protein [bacterium]|nr:HDOD domain-containing protein [bacterium]
MIKEDEKNTKSHKLQEVVVARQPIFDKKKEVFAYELLFRSDFQEHLTYAPTTKKKGKTSIEGVDSIFISGLKRLTNGKKAVINFNREMLLNKLPLVFPSDLLGVEIHEDSESDNKMTKSVSKLKNAGYLVVINDSLFNQADFSLIKLADVVGVDFRSGGLQKRISFFEDNHTRPRFLARSVETACDYDLASEKGYQYFQGSFFSAVDMVSVRSIPGYKMNLMRILREINKPAVEFSRIEEILKKDVSITYKLLRLINSASFGFKTQVQSIHHALTLLGEGEIRKWLSLIVLSSVGTDKPQELVRGTLVRAKLCESIASKLNYKRERSNFFLMGMFSMVDAFLGRPMPEILVDLPLDTHIKDALLGNPNHYRDVLELVIGYEKAEWRTFDQMTENLGIDRYILSGFYIDAVEWGKLL